MRPAILKGAMHLPVERIDVAKVKAQLSVRHTPMGEEPQLVEAFFVKGDRLCVPRQYGLSLCERLGIEVEDQTSLGTPVTFPKRPVPRDYQVPLLSKLARATQDFYDYLFRAHTGWGKTVGALLNAADLGTTTLVIVDQENLMDQWVAAAQTHFGMRLGHEIGVVQGSKRDYEGRMLVIAMVQTLTQQEFPDEFWNYFGHCIVDEVHTIGAPTFSRNLLHVNAAYRLGVSATPKRRDTLNKLIEFSLGIVRVAADKKHKENAVYFARHGTVYSWYANISPKVGRIISEVAEDGSRNLLIAEAATWLYQTGRDVLVLSDRITHLTHLMNLFYYLGVPAEDMGLYSGEYYRYGYAKEANPLRRPRGVERHAETGDYEYTPISLQLISRKTPKRKLEQVKTTAKIIFATFGKFAKGVDEPRLKGGVDATPRSAAEQVHGRVLREVQGAQPAVWITIADTNSYRLMHSFSKRVGEYVNSNARMFEWHADGEIEEWHAAELREHAKDRSKDLKSLQIETRSDGHNILLTRQESNRRKATRDRAIVNKFRSARRGSPTACSPEAPRARSTATRSNTPSVSRPSPSPRRRKRLVAPK